MTQTAPHQPDAAEQQAREQAVTDEVVASFGRNLVARLPHQLEYPAPADGWLELIDIPTEADTGGQDAARPCEQFSVGRLDRRWSRARRIA